MIQSEQFTPFFGVVEAIDTEAEMGRVKVRVHGYNTSNKGVLPTDSLRWFGVLNGNTAALKGVGTSPNGYKVGSFVFGYYIDEHRTQGIVVGSVAGLDDISELVRGKTNEHINAIKAKTLKGVPSADDSSWNEPETTYAPKYPKNFVHVSESGHVIEIDDTDGAERVKISHKSGSLIEMHPDGSVVVRSNKTFDIVYEDRHVKSGNHTESVDSDKYEQVGGKTIRRSNRTQQYQAPKIELGQPGSLEPIVLGNKLRDWINDTLVPWLNSHTHTSSSPGSPTSPPIKPFQAGSAQSGGAIYSKKNSSQ